MSVILFTGGGVGFPACITGHMTRGGLYPIGESASGGVGLHPGGLPTGGWTYPSPGTGKAVGTHRIGMLSCLARFLSKTVTFLYVTSNVTSQSGTTLLFMTLSPFKLLLCAVLLVKFPCTNQCGSFLSSTNWFRPESRVSGSTSWCDEALVTKNVKLNMKLNVKFTLY